MRVKTFSDIQELNILLLYYIPEKATGGWAAPKQEKHRIQETKDPVPNWKEGVKLQEGRKGSSSGNRCADTEGVTG